MFTTPMAGLSTKRRIRGATSPRSKVRDLPIAQRVPKQQQRTLRQRQANALGYGIVGVAKILGDSHEKAQIVVLGQDKCVWFLVVAKEVID